MIELVVAMVLALVIFGGVGTALLAGMREQARILGRTTELEGADLGLQQLVRDLRQATGVSYVSTSSLTYLLPVPTGTQSVTFSCSTTTQSCTRTISGVPVTTVTNVTNSDVFTMSPSTSNPTYVAIKLVVSPPHQQPITLTDGAGLRNVTAGR